MYKLINNIINHYIMIAACKSLIGVKLIIKSGPFDSLGIVFL